MIDVSTLDESELEHGGCLQVWLAIRGGGTAPRLVDLDSLERHCTVQLQPKGGDLGNPFTPAGAEPRGAGSAHVEATRVLAAIDGETRKAHSAYVLGRGESFAIVPVEQRRRPAAR